MTAALPRANQTGFSIALSVNTHISPVSPPSPHGVMHPDLVHLHSQSLLVFITRPHPYIHLL
jgi:hypothetical protein